MANEKPNFEFWQQWGDGLDDADFARAFIALGIVAASDAKPSGSEGYLGLLQRGVAPPTSDVYLEIARSALTDALSAAREHAQRLPWRFPNSASSIDAERTVLLARISPQTWARAWSDVTRVVDVRPRLRVTDAPEADAIAPWFGLLARVEPPPTAVSLDLPATNANLAFEWPLRFGTLQGGGGDAVIAEMLANWPGSRLAHRVAIDRDNANCDVLLHAGGAASLLGSLLAQPFRCKANIVALVEPIDADPVTLNARVRAIATETCASGIVLQPAADEPRVSGLAWNTFIEEMSHNVTIDRALYVAMGRTSDRPAVIWLTDALADLRLHSLVDRLTARVRALPVGSAIDLRGMQGSWARIARARLSRGRVERSEAVPDAELARTDTTRIAFDAGGLSFESESHGASDLAILTTAVDTAVEPADAESRRAARYLQQRSFVNPGSGYIEAREGFLTGRPALVRVRIGPPEAEWQSLPSEFPVEQLPPGHKQWRLTLWLTEPSQLTVPLRRTLVLPREGPSTACDFRFTPPGSGRFEGRLTVLHRGRVLQTAVLSAGVSPPDGPRGENSAPVLRDIIPVRHRLGDLDRRRQFDLAFVTNHTVTGEPRGVALSNDRAWIANVAKSLEVTKDLNTALSRVAKSVLDFADGLDGTAGRALLVDLAKKGAWLELYLVSGQLKNPHNRPDIAEKEFIQIVSTESDATVPFEFIYDYAVPSDDAVLCARWREGVTQGKCPSACDTASAATVCPMGFWGLRKVIERHQVSVEHAQNGSKFFLQSEPGRNSSELRLGGVALLASSTRVSDAALKTLAEVLTNKLGSPPHTAASWSAWASIVGGQAEPRLLLALPHTDGTGANVTLEIGGDTISTIQITEAHLRPNKKTTGPLVALLGCDVAGTANDYGEHVVVFRDRGAAIVIGTIATVFGEHAAAVAGLLADALIPDGTPPQRLGEAIRALKRRALLDGLLMPLCVVAYGDADWRIVR